MNPNQLQNFNEILNQLESTKINLYLMFLDYSDRQKLIELIKSGRQLYDLLTKIKSISNSKKVQ